MAPTGLVTEAPRLLMELYAVRADPALEAEAHAKLSELGAETDLRLAPNAHAS